MLNRNAVWRYLLLFAVVAFGVFYALPNLYGQDPAVQISRDKVGADLRLLENVQAQLDAAELSYTNIELEEGRLLVRFKEAEEQLKAADLLNDALNDQHIVALNLANKTPEWLRNLNAEPMSLGLDLRGGVHFLMEVDLNFAEQQAIEDYATELRRSFRERFGRVPRVKEANQRIVLQSRGDETPEQVVEFVADEFPELELTETQPEKGVELRLTELELKNRQEFALQQNIITLRNRVNQLGVAEPLVQQAGKNRIVVELPGVQDPSQVKRIIDSTATLEYRAVDTDHNASEAKRSGRVPISSKLYEQRDGGPILLSRDVIVKGSNIVDANSGLDSESGTPSVFVTLDSAGAKRMGKFTTENVGKPMAVVFIEYKTEQRERNGEIEFIQTKQEEVVSVASIREPFSKRFQTTGLEQKEAKDLALLLRAGALAAPVFIVEERTVGPSMGQENIDQGFLAVVIGFGAVVLFMILYYRVFGIVANFALILNLVLLIAIMSLMQATLTLPGIAGIVLTVGMAVDANVLIFERIREEIRAGAPAQSAIHAGYEKAFSTIADANITTLIAAVVLFMMGDGPVKGFAITLSIGILCSMFTAIFGTRVLVNLIYGGRKVNKLFI